MRSVFWMKSLGLMLVVLCALALACGDDDDDADPTQPDQPGPIAATGGTTPGVTGGAAGGAGASGAAPPATGGAAGGDTGGAAGGDTGGAAGSGTGGTAGSGAAPVDPGPGAGTGEAGAPPPEVDAGGSGAGGEPAPGEDASVPVPADGGDIAPDPDNPMPGTVPIDAPVPDDCITDVSPGDHTFNCDDVQYLVMVDEICTQFACGLILDAHGGSMDGQWERDSTELEQLAPPQGFLTVHPTAATRAWNYQTEMPKLVDFINRMIDVFHVDENRIHVTGFSMGSGVTFWFLCNQREMLASAGPVSGQSADQIVVVDTGENCIESIGGDWEPRVPILFISGTQDGGLTEARARARTDGIVTRLGLTGGEEIDSGPGWVRQHWEDGEGMVFDFIMHDWTGLLSGHCIPSGDGFASCFDTDPSFHWGETILQFFIDHPRRR